MIQEPAKKRHFSFSILTLLLLTTIAGLVFALIESRNRLGKLEPELERANLFARPLEIVDSTRTQVISLPTGSPYFWRWRIRAADDARYMMGLTGGKIPDEGVPASGTVQLVGSGLSSVEDFIVTVELRPTRKGSDPDIEWVETSIKIEQGADPAKLLKTTGMTQVLKVGRGGVKRYADLIMGPQYGSKPAHGIDASGRDGQESFAADEPIQLLRVQYNKPEGILIWFQPFGNINPNPPIAARPTVVPKIPSSVAPPQSEQPAAASPQSPYK